MTFWTKCEKLIVTEDSKLVKCDECPCGYYALFAFKRFNINQKTMETDYCSPSISVEAFEVIDNKINAGEWCRRCIEISRTPDDKDVVGYSRGCFCCWEDCVDWDDEGNCTQMEEWCNDCSEIWVYRMSPCFDKYDDFAAWFYSGCEAIPDEEGNYPELWDGYKVMTGAANNCVWNHWQGVAERKYYTWCYFEWNTRVFDYNINPYAQKYAFREECLYDCENGGCIDYDADGNCIECEDGSSLIKYCREEVDHPEYEALHVTWFGGEKYFKTGGYCWFDSSCENGKGCWRYEYPELCEFWDGSVEALAEFNEWVATFKENLDQFRFDVDEKNSIGPGNRCHKRYYDAHHGGHDHGLFIQSVTYGNMKFTRHTNTPPKALGVKVAITAYTQYAIVTGSIIESDERTYIYDNEIVKFPFDEMVRFSLVDNLLPYFWGIWATSELSGCQYGDNPKLFYEGYRNVTEFFQMEITIIDYYY